MAKLLYVEDKSLDKTRVYGTHNMPLDKEHGEIQEVIDANVLVNEIPERPQDEPGKAFVHYVNPHTKEQWYEEIDVPLFPDQQIQADMGAILFESAMDKARIKELEDAQATMVMEIAMLKMGGNV
jgi:hypothetical protein